MDKLLRINMGAEGGPAASAVPVGEYAGLGGRALTSAIVAKEVPPLAHPLGEDNKLVIAPGMLSGTIAAMSGRCSVGGKSPLTGGIKESNSGGQASQVLARLGYAAIILEGKPKENDLYKIFVNKDGVKITIDNSLRMLGNYDLIEKMKGEYGDKMACVSIGPAGEMKMYAASVAFTDMELRPTRHAGRGGLGAVMGSKGVKVIVLDDAGMSNRAPKDVEKFRAANKAFVDGLKKHPVTGEGLPSFGTNILANVINEAGAYPTHNFLWGRFAGTSLISGETEAEYEKARGGNPTHGCHRGCVIRCSGIYHDKDGHYLTKQPEYETVWAHGANCGIDDLDKIAVMDRLDDDFGLDTIEMGATIGVAMEAGIAKFGDADAAIQLLREAGKGSYSRAHPGEWRRVYGQGLRRRAGPRREGAGASGLRSAGHPGHRRHLRHEHDGRRPHGRLRGGHQHPQGGGLRRPAEAGRADRAVPESPDRHGGHRFHGDVPLHRLCDHGPARHLPGAPRPAQCLLWAQHDGRRRHGAGEKGSQDGTGVQCAGRTYEGAGPSAGILPEGAASPAQRHVPGERRGAGQGV